MREIAGYQSIGAVAEQLGISEPKLRRTMEALGIVAATMPGDLRGKWLSDAEVARMQQWLQEPQDVAQ
jgi:hypothetical protein